MAKNKLSKAEVDEICTYLNNTINTVKSMSIVFNKPTTSPVYEILANLLHELKTNNSYHCLEDEVVRISQQKNEIEELKTEICTYNSKLSDLERQLIDMKQMFKIKNIELDTEIEEQSIALNNLNISHTSELAFEKCWLGVQLQELDLFHELTIKDLEQQFINLKNECGREELVHAELLWYYGEELENIKKEISLFCEDMDENIRERKSSLNLFSVKRELLLSTLKQQKSEYLKRRSLMDEFLMEKEQRRKEEEYMCFLNTNATIIQAWWRGIMVRKFLGPYNYLKAIYSRKRKFSLKKNKKVSSTLQK